MSSDLLRLYIYEAIIQESKKIPKKNAFSLKDLLPQTPIETGLTTAIFGMLLSVGINLKNNNELPTQNPATAIIKSLKNNTTAKNAIQKSGAEKQDLKKAFNFLNQQTAQGVTIEELYDSYKEGDIDLDEADNDRNQATLLNDFLKNGKSYFESLESIDEIESLVNDLNEAMSGDQMISLIVDGSEIKDTGKTPASAFISQLGDFYKHIESLRKKEKTMEMQDRFFVLAKSVKRSASGYNSVSSTLKQFNTYFGDMQEDNPDQYTRLVEKRAKELDDDYPGMGLSQTLRDAAGL